MTKQQNNEAKMKTKPRNKQGTTGVCDGRGVWSVFSVGGCVYGDGSVFMCMSESVDGLRVLFRKGGVDFLSAICVRGSYGGLRDGRGRKDSPAFWEIALLCRGGFGGLPRPKKWRKEDNDVLGFQTFDEVLRFVRRYCDDGAKLKELKEKNRGD